MSCHGRVVVGFRTLQSVPITTKVVSLNPTHGEVYSIQLYGIKFVNDLQFVCDFSLGPPVSSNNKTDCHNISEILLKVALNTITPAENTKYTTHSIIHLLI